MTWIFAFIYGMNIHATGMLLDEATCREMLATTSRPAVCINAEKPRLRIYRERKHG